MKRLLPFIFIIVLLGLIVCLPFFLPLDRFRTQIADTLSQRLNQKVVVEKLELVMFPPSLRLRGVAVLDSAGGPPRIQIEQVLTPLDWKGLLRAKIVPQEISLRGWTATVTREPNGSWPWGKWMGPAQNLSGKSNWALKKITFDRGECRAVDPYGPGPAEFTAQILQGSWKSQERYLSINGVFISLPTPVNFLFQASGQFMADAQWSGVLELNDENRQQKLELKAASNRLEATGQADQWRFDTAYAFIRYYSRLPVHLPVTSTSAILQGWQSRFDWQANTLSFTQTATVAGGRSESKGTVVFGPSSSTASVDVALQSVSLQPIESVLFGSSPLEGNATGLAHVEVTLSSSPWSSLNGKGALEIKDGKYFLPESATRNLTKARTMRYLHKKYPGFLASGLAFKKASMRLQLRRGTVFFDDGFADLGNIQVAVAGSYDVARRGLDAFTRVQVHERNTQLVKELPPAYVDLSHGTPYIQPMHGRIQGPPAQWHLRATRASKVPPATLNKLSNTIRKK